MRESVCERERERVREREREIKRKIVFEYLLSVKNCSLLTYNTGRQLKKKLADNFHIINWNY